MHEVKPVDTTDVQDLLRLLAVAATGLTGADVERLVREARQVARRASRSLTYSDIENAISRGRPTMSEDVRWHVSVHEAGHAVAWTATGRGRVQRMTVGPVSGGRTEVNVKTDRVEDEGLFNDVLCCLLAGRAAESVIFGKVFAGSGGSQESDLAQATMQAIRMETEFGMSDVTPLLYMPMTHVGQDLRLDPSLARAVNARLESSYDRARSMMDLHKAAISALAARLAERTVLEANEVEIILAAHFDERPDS